MRSRRASLAQPIKDEITEIARIAAAARDAGAAVRCIQEATAVSTDQASHVLGLLTGGRDFTVAWDQLATTTGWDRTSAVRSALQYWGTEVRRASQPTYWVDKAVEAALTELAEGVVPYFTDVRFPDEATGLQAIGYRLVRVEVTRATQRSRLANRDGIALCRSAIEHSSETALDDFDGFDIVVSNDGELDTASDQVLKSLH